MSNTSFSKTRANALKSLLSKLADEGYSFLTPTPETHSLVLNTQNRDGQVEGKSLTDVFGWSLPCTKDTLDNLFPASLVEALLAEGIFTQSGSLYKSEYRVSSIRTSTPNALYLHSSFPPKQDSVFFGPDTYRYLDYLDAHLPSLSFSSDEVLVDVCTGGGAGAQSLIDQFPKHTVLGLDINSKALDLACLNVPQAQFKYSSLLDVVAEEKVACVISNPPYISGLDQPTYASGGKEGLGITFSILEQSAKLLKKGGKVILYTGVTMDWREPNRDILRERVEESEEWRVLRYDILDVDVFANEIGRPGYETAGRTQVIGCILERS